MSTRSRIPRMLGRKVDDNAVSGPAEWPPGGSVPFPAPSTMKDARSRSNGGGAGMAAVTWCLANQDGAAQAK
jgi:hypothetical protein